MKNKREVIGIFLICAIMVAFGLAFNQEKDWGYLPFMGFMAAICAAWFFITLVYIYLHQRRVVLRWNTAYAAWKSGGSAEDYLEAMEQCEEELKDDTGTTLTYGGIPLKEYILVHKIFLLKEMERKQECLALLKSIQPKIKNSEVQKALSELETEISKGL